MNQDYIKIEKIIRYLDANFLEQPDLKMLSRKAGLSEFHFQRLFTRWAGVSPKRFMQYLTKEHACKLLEQSKDILSASLESGLSGPGRLHDLFVNCEAMTPGDYKAGGEGIEITYGWSDTPFGTAFIGMTSRGICSFSFGKPAEQLADCKRRWPKAEFKENASAAKRTIHAVFAQRGKLNLLLGGTNFQIKVWEALLRIPEGRVTTYADIAREIGHPKAVRAVGTAVGNNPIAYLIPCHRVIRSLGVFGNYRWGEERKKAILGWEMAHTDVAA